VNRSVAGVMLALVAALAAIGLLTGEEETSEPAAEGPSGPSLEQIARRVERVRELEFDRLPRVVRVSEREVGRAALRELDRQMSTAEVEAEEQLLELLGLLPAGADIRDLLATALAGEVGGYYVPRTGTLALVRGTGLGGLFEEVALAHELTHALEDQRFGIASRGASGFLRDRATAEGALHEGTATVVMVDYLLLTRGGADDVPAELRAQVLEEIEGVALPASSGLPRYLREGLVFPYVYGAALVNRIESESGWAAVDRAFGPDAPVSTEQVLHPEKHAARERPVRLRLSGHRGALPRAARRLSEGDFGEFDTEQLLREGNGRERSERAAAGWGGGAFELWRLPGGDCEEPCRERHVLVMGWDWDSARDAAEFEAAAERTLSALGAAGAVAGGRGDRVTVVLAPTAALGRRIARRAGR
jgi:hypothetical protein